MIEASKISVYLVWFKMFSYSEIIAYRWAGQYDLNSMNKEALKGKMSACLDYSAKVIFNFR